MSAKIMQRIVVIGSTGTGKSTLAKQVAARLGCNHVELDSLHWEADWKEAPTDVFISRVEQALSGDCWVVDGQYNEVRNVIWSRADTIVWLDYPLSLILWRLARRSVSRLFTREELWNGNRESFRTHFSRNSLFIWGLKSYERRRRDYEQFFQEYTHLKILRLHSSGETEKWLKEI
jgi:adenylate kinase family enzyme